MYNSAAADPYITGGWAEHAWGQCTGDYMGTNQSTKGNTDGGILFWFYDNGSPMCDKYSATQWDGCYGLKRFFISRGYTVNSNCTQVIYNSSTAPNGCTFADFKAEIDAGRPAMLQLDGHTVLGYGYDLPSTVYLHDTWNYGDHTMTWGGSYSGLAQWGMTYIRLAAVTPNPCDYVISLGGGGSANAQTYVGGGEGVWNTSCGYSTPAIEQVYSFVAPVNGYYSIQVTAAGSWVDYSWKAGTCASSGWNCIASVYSPGTYGSMYMSAGSTYSILLDGEDFIEDNHQFYIFYNPCEAGNITTIAGTGVGNVHTYSGGGNGAWFTSSASPCGFYCPGREHVYSFVAPASGNYSIVVSAASGGNYVDYLYRTATSCSSTGWTCIDDLNGVGTSPQPFPMIQGTTYYILADCESTSATTQTFYLSLTEPAGSWLGTVSNNWFTPANWSANIVPISTTDVTINTGYTYYPIVYSGTATCNDITMGTGTMMKVNAGNLNVTGSMNISGQLAMDNAAGVLTVNGNVTWQSGSTANFTAATVMWVYGDWTFASGSNVQLANGNVDFAGSTTNYIITNSANSAFHNLGSYKTTGNILGLSFFSTQDLTVNGNLYTHTNATFGGYSTHSLILNGEFQNNYHFLFNYGTMVFNGVNQSIKPNVGDYFYNIIISPTGTTSVDNTWSNTLTVKGYLLIESGVFDPMNNIVEVGKDWTNTVGPAGFTEGAGKVVFNGGNFHQYCSTETFNTVEVNKTLGGAFRVNGGTVTCQNYDWTAGAVDVLTGIFTANNLVDDGLYGNYYLNPGGTINLSNYDGYVDLDGNLYIYGGNFNVYGGTTDSDWSFASNASLTMSGGILDFKTRGIRVYNLGPYSFTSTVTAGTIRTVGKFDNQRSTFAPTGGTIEMYGSVDAAVSTGAGCSLYNLLINKSVTDISSGTNPLSDKEGNLIEQPLSNTASATGSLVTLTGDLTVQSGTFDLNTCTVNVTGDVHINTATLKMTNAADKLTCSSINWNSGSNDNINNGEIDVNYWNFLNGTNATLSVPNLAVVKSSISPEDSDAEFGNFKAIASSKSMDNSSVYYPVRVTGNCTFAAGATWYTNVDWLIGGNLNIENTASFTVYSGADILVNGNFTLDGTLSIQSGASALVHGDFIFPNTGVLDGSGGTFTNDYSLSNLTLSGTFQVSSGLVEFPYRNVFLSGTFNDQITGGTMKFGKTFTATLPGVFQPTGGTVEFINASAGNYVQVTSDNFLNDVIVNKPGSSYQVYNDLTIKGNLTFIAGTLAAGDKTIYVGGNWNNLVGSAGFNEGTGTVVFNGALAADVLSAETFYNLNLNKTYALSDGLELFHDVTVSNDLHNIDGSMKLKDPARLDVTGNVSIDLGGGLNASDYYPSSLSGPQITVGRNWTNANADHTSEHGFAPGNYSTVTFNGAADQSLTTACAQEDFNNLKIDKTTGSFRPNDNTQTYGNILIQRGSWEDNLNGLTHSVFGDFTVASTGSFLTTSIANTVEFKGGQNSVLTYSGVLGYFRNLLVNKTVGYGVTQATDIYTQFGGNLTVGTGTYNLGGNFLIVTGDVAVNNTGILTLPAASILALTDTRTLNINSGGRIDVAGTSGNKVNIRANTFSARYNFNVNSGGTIAADYCIFKNMGISGINVKSGSSIDLAHSFKGCTFQDGASGGTLLTIDNSETRTIRNAVFPTNIWGGASNVTKTVNAGFVYFVDYSGLWSGEANDNDVNNRLQWVPTLIAAPTATPAAICPGSPSQLHAVASGGVGPYTYAWSPAGSLSDAALENPVATPSVTTIYTVQVTDGLATIGTGNVTVTVLPVLTPSVTIAASANPSVPGDFVNYTATPFNGGGSPTYVWKRNGSPVGTGPTYFYKPGNHDEVTCEMTSSYACSSENPVISNVITMIVIPATRTETGTINAPLSLCFDASNTITVAGGGDVFVVKTGASAVFIAGVKISFLPGTTVENGGYMHGYIATTNNYCGFAPAPAPAIVAGEGESTTGPMADAQMFSIYPNPTTGVFTLLNKGDVRFGNVRVEMFDLRGNMVYSTNFGGERDHKVTLPPLTPGLYFVKVISGNLIESFKVIVTR